MTLWAGVCSGCGHVETRRRTRSAAIAIQCKRCDTWFGCERLPPKAVEFLEGFRCPRVPTWSSLVSTLERKGKREWQMVGARCEWRQG